MKSSLQEATIGHGRLAGKRVAAVTFSSFPFDPRPRRAAETLAEEGASVDVICLRESDEEPEHESFSGIDITRVLLKRKRGGKLSYILQYGYFVLLCGAILGRRALSKRYDLVHIHNMPDFLVFSALGPKLLGAKVILDLHDPMPELMTAIFGLGVDSQPMWVLKMFEKLSIGFADAVLTVNEGCRKIFLGRRDCRPEKITVIMNSPDETIFQYREVPSECLGTRDPSKPFVIMYHGSLVERHGLDLAVTALEKIRESIPGAELRICGKSTSFLEQVMSSVLEKPELLKAVHYLGPKSLNQIVEAIRECDLGVIPNRRSVFTELNTPTRIFEHLSQGKVVISPKAQGILDYFAPDDLVYFELGDADDLAAKVEYVYTHPEEVSKIVERGQSVYLAHKWSAERLRFVSIVEGLLKVPRCGTVPAEGWSA
jgi:glycosyltransferase involved in cell wall biosynthesis